MQVTKWLYFAAIWILVECQEDDGLNLDTQNYEYRYFVRDEGTRDIKSQEETKQGGVVTGHYSLEEPTGKRRVVTYKADDGGFRADVKYEDSEFPEDKANQQSAKSGVEFHWLPAQPGSIQEGKSDTEQDKSDEGSGNGIESTTATMSETPSESTSEATTENTSTQTSNDISTSESSQSESTTEGSSETSSMESSSEQTSKSDSEITLTSVETSSESNALSTESSAESTTTAAEGKNTDKPAADSDQSAEAAESAPVSEEVLPPSPPSQMYLPVISYQNLPFLNLPVLDNTQGYSEKPPTIIYASQNFYNPWQWFGSGRRAVREAQVTHGYNLRLIKNKEYQFVQKTK